MPDNSRKYGGRTPCGCTFRGTTVGESQRTWLVCRVTTYFMLLLSLGVIPWVLEHYWDNWTTTGRVMTICLYILQISVTFAPVFPIKRCCQKILKRKRLVFRPKSSTVSLRSALTNLKAYILTSEKAKKIEQQATGRMDVISEHISESFHGNPIKFSLTGGFAEGYGVPLSSKWITIEGDIDNNHALISDFDFMFELDDIFAGYNPSENVDFLITTKDCQLGYAKLMVHNPRVGSKFGCDGEYLSAKLVKRKIYKSVSETDMSIYPGFKSYIPMCCLRSSNKHFVKIKISGPAIKLKVGSSEESKTYLVGVNNNNLTANAQGKLETNHFLADITFSIWYKEFPQISNFDSRTDRRWPSPEDVDRIVNMGCHLVPKSQEEKDKKELTWRFSFSKAEVELSKLINDTARKCFLALKIILKDHLSFTCSRISSYHFKTIFLNMVEETGLEAWTEENIEIMLKSLLNKVKNAVDSRICRHFWIPEINLFEEIPDEKLDSVSKILDKILENPAPYIQHRKSKGAQSDEQHATNLGDTRVDLVEADNITSAETIVNAHVEDEPDLQNEIHVVVD